MKCGVKSDEGDLFHCSLVTYHSSLFGAEYRVCWGEWLVPNIE